MSNGFIHFVAILLTVGTTSSFAQAQVCTPTTVVNRQYRTALKHRENPSPPGPSTSVQEILAWAPPPGTAPGVVLESVAPADPRESEEFTIEGDAWRVGREPNDCDLHAEIAPPGAGPSADRVIIEIPQGTAFQSARDALAEALPSGHEPSGPPRGDLQVPIRIRVTGTGFWDGEHTFTSQPLRGHNHGSRRVGTLWEIHPVHTLTVLGGDGSASRHLRDEGSMAGPLLSGDALRQALGVSVDPNASRPVGGLGSSGTPSAPATPSPSHHASGEHLQCCDGSRSPTCTCDRDSFRGCCSHHGGVCGGCD